jgi:hypothetical protein
MKTSITAITKHVTKHVTNHLFSKSSVNNYPSILTTSKVKTTLSLLFLPCFAALHFQVEITIKKKQ